MSIHKEPGFFGKILQYKRLGANPEEALKEAKRQGLPSDPSIPGAVSTPQQAAEHFGKTARQIFGGRKQLVERARKKRLGQ